MKKEYNQIEKALSELEEKYASERMDVLESIPTDDNEYPNAEELSKVNDIIEFLTSAENYVNHFRTIISDSFQNRLQTPNSDNGDGQVNLKDVSITNQKNQDPIGFLDQAKNLLDQAKKSRSTNFLDLEKSIKAYSPNQEKDFKEGLVGLLNTLPGVSATEVISYGFNHERSLLEVKYDELYSEINKDGTVSERVKTFNVDQVNILHRDVTSKNSKNDHAISTEDDEEIKDDPFC